MKLYHGSTAKVIKPHLTKCRANTDFGKGFYTTSSKEQAEKWAILKQQRSGSTAVVSEFEFDESILLDSGDLKILHFTGADKSWLDFVFANRKGLSAVEYNIVLGPVANDRLFTTITLYENGVLSANAAIEQLKTYVLFDQISFHSKNAIDRLIFVNAYKVEAGK